MSKVSDGRDGVAGRAEHRGRRRAVHHAEHDRVPGPHRHAVHRERADLGHDRGGVVVAARRSSRRSRPRGRDLAAAVAHRGGDLGRARRARPRSGAPRSPPPRPGPRASASSCRAARPRRARSRPAGSRRRSGSRPRPAGGGRPARSPRRRPRRRRPPAAAGGPRAAAARRRSRPRRSSGRAGTARRPRAARRAVVLGVDVLAHDDGVEVARDRVAGVHDLEGARRRGGRAWSRSPRPCLRRAPRCRPSRRRRRAARSVCAQTGSAVTRPTASSSGSSHGLDPLRAAGRRAGLLPGGERLGGRDGRG